MRPWVMAALGTAVALVAVAPQAAAAAVVERVSVAGDGRQGDGDSDLPAISANGRYVAFESAASNLAAADPNRCQPPSQDIFCTGDVFVRDRRSRKTERVSVAPDGSQSDGDSASAAVSADGRYVAFVSGASNLVAGDTNDHGDVFVRDRQSNTIERVSVAADGTEADASSGSPAVSADGRYVAFDSTASNLVGLNANNAEDVFVRDLQSGAIERVSVAADGTEGNGPSASPAISADGRYVAFDSNASNLVADDTNDHGDVFVRDRQSGATERVSVAGNGRQGNDQSYFSAISADGRYVVFASDASTLVARDTNRGADVFVRDRRSKAIERVSLTGNGRQANGESFLPAISADGRYVTFASEASNLVAGDTNHRADVFVRDQRSGRIRRVNTAGDGTQANRASYFSAISANGRYVAFASDASNLVPRDTNSHDDVFVSDLRWAQRPV